MPYTGGKSQSGLYQRIINLIPPHRVYIEPFLGSGAIMRLKRPARRSIGLDLGGPPELALPPGAEFLRADGIGFLESFPWTGEEFVYADPPYLPSTRGGRRHYRFEMTESDHVRLLRVLQAIPSKVLLSGYPSELYYNALSGWPREEFQVMTRGHTLATEVLWFNYPRPAALHDLRYVGRDSRERWRIEKRRRRWRARLQRMPVLERATLFAALLDVMGPAAVSGAAVPGASFGAAGVDAGFGVVRSSGADRGVSERELLVRGPADADPAEQRDKGDQNFPRSIRLALECQHDGADRD